MFGEVTLYSGKQKLIQETALCVNNNFKYYTKLTQKTVSCINLKTCFTGKSEIIGSEIGGNGWTGKSFLYLSFFGYHINCL